MRAATRHGLYDAAGASYRNILWGDCAPGSGKVKQTDALFQRRSRKIKKASAWRLDLMVIELAFSAAFAYPQYREQGERMRNLGLGAAILVGAFVVAISAAPAFAHHEAGHSGGRPSVASVPEIDAASGLAALSAVCAALALAWERRRRS